MAAVLEVKGERLQVLTQTNRELTVARKRILHACPAGKAGARSRQEWLTLLEETARRREQLKGEINLEEVWELLAAEEKSLPVEEMADLWFGSALPDQVAAMGRALFEDRFLFKYKDGRWLPHTAEVVESLKEKARREEETRRELAEAARWLRTAWEGGEITDPAWRERLLPALREVAVFGQEAPAYPVLKSYLDQAKIPGEDAPFRILVRLGVFSEDENLALYRLEVPVEFPEPVLAAAHLLTRDQPPDPYAALREDLTHLECLTIDGERTRDLDDALSLEPHPEGWVLGVHIADVSSLVPPDSPLDREAQERATSIYLPETRLPMLPEEISEDVLSLVAQQERRSLSFLAVVTETGELRSWELKPSLIRVRRRLSYTEADRLLARDETLERLHGLTAALKARRLAQGGYELKLPEVWVSFDAHHQVQVTVENQETPSHELVSEAMVLANRLAAEFLSEQGVPAIFRGQPEPREPIERDAPKTLLELWLDRRKLSRVTMELTPQPHWGLGLPCYTFASSPIRRYLDLVSHRQVLSVLAGGPPAYSGEDLARILTVIEPAMRRAAQLKFQRLRYWLLKYLSQRVGQKLEALVVEAQPHRTRLLFPDILLEVPWSAPATLRLKPGDTVQVRLDKVLPREDQVKLSLA
uniref:RNB domain-containing ribonuclease n=1 Tax=Desulfobacca acetoxidans TaxID=60893 RepID=A0A7V4G707_9BACT